jgi:hypothetical protein
MDKTVRASFYLKANWVKRQRTFPMATVFPASGVSDKEGHGKDDAPYLHRVA